MTTDAVLWPVPIRDHWTRVRPRLAEIMAGMDEWPEDVYSDCVNGDAHLYLADNEGFVVLRKTRNRFTGSNELIVWVASLFEDSQEPDAVARYLEALVVIARTSGCVKVEFRTRREGFERLLTRSSAQRFGEWRKSLVTYELAVPHGKE